MRSTTMRRVTRGVNGMSLALPGHGRNLVMTALATSLCLAGVSAHAQHKPKKPAAPAAPAQPAGQPAPVDLDADQPLQKQMQQQVQQEQQKQHGSKPAKVVDTSPPATAGQPTDAAAQAK